MNVVVFLIDRVKINFVHSKLFLLASPTNEKFNVTGVQFTHCFLRLDFCLNYLIRGSLKIRDKMRARIAKYKQKINKLCACQRVVMRLNGFLLFESALSHRLALNLINYL